MKKIFLVLFPVFILAKIYSIQLYTADKDAIKSTLNFYNGLPPKIKNLSVIYKTDSGYLTVRYTAAEKIKDLKRYTNNLKHYSFVNDNENKIKTLFLEKYKKTKNKTLKKLLLKLKWLKPAAHTNKNKTQTKKKEYKKQKKALKTHTYIPDWVKMAIALHNYDTEKIKKLLNTEIDYYQKIDALNKLQRYKDAQSVIFNNYSYNLALTYLENIKKSGRFVSFSSSVKRYSKYSNRYSNLEFYDRNVKTGIEYNKIYKKNDKKISFKTEYMEMFLQNINSDTLAGILYKYKLHKLNTTFALNQNVFESDKAYISTKQHYLNLSYKFPFDINTEFLYSKFYTFSDRFLLNKYRFQFQRFKTLNSNLAYSVYLKYVIYSKKHKSYTESGGNIFYGNEEVYLKTFKPFAVLGVLYNTETKFGYSIKTGFSRSVISADSFKVFVKYSKNSLTDEKELEVLLNYIYWY
jgi:hypothetical protein